ncbi:hypothetical protein Dacet_0794 [Denitrovibrio acetiphilus DSM 12809]|uniref:Cytochrome c7-like domain-containing protein n=1 Tax=Denitrovibrio acetiphilus (strain DSM 12809 / NBRC 114555 / N2460) TaxID=522772 RepID=D4H5F4_DENA2|nr:cytochrome c3 family protein [Denitrovibrio acetiphilus]ADD67574.1 hypothetical protein Dacet_0794 [Denitrovibrio acetiphilus DSM 12809]
MIKKFSWLLLIMITFAAVFGCAKFYYQSPLVKFNHEEHVDILFQQKRDCFYCHKLPNIETFIQQDGELKITPELKVDGQCHTCHKNRNTKVASAPHNCNICHENMKVMRPDDHVNNWMTLHAAEASLNMKECESCHKDWYCESCHTKQNSAEKIRHSRSFKLKHSMEAMIDPGSCDTCHRVDFCMTCHRDGFNFLSGRKK